MSTTFPKSGLSPVRRGRRHARRGGRGVALVLAIFVLLALAGIAAYVVTTATVQQSTSAADLNGTRAYQAARAGLEWGAYQVLQNPAGGYCAGATDSATITGLGGNLGPFTTVVACTHTSHREAAAAANVEMYTLVATACNQPPCPSSSPSLQYVERQITMMVSR